MLKKNTLPISALAMLMFLAMMAADLFSSLDLPLLGNADEFMGIIAWIAVLFYLFRNIRSIKKSVMYPMACLLFMLLIGILGNIRSGVINSKGMIVLDAFLFSKPYIIFVFGLLFFQKYARRLVPYFARIARLAIWILTICALCSQVIPMGMRSEDGDFIFLASYGGTVSWWMILFLGLVWTDKKSDKELIQYLVMGGIVILLNGSGLGIITYGIGVMMFIVLEKKKKIRWYYIVLAIAVCAFLGRNEITEYLLTSTAPRAMLLRYAFVTANTYAPFGSGFATYGSAAAIREYSKLYYAYGFARIYGMTKEYHPYLMDNYYQQIIGQLGYPGFLALGLYIYKIVQRVLSFHSASIRNGTLLLYGCLLVASIAFGTAGSWGCTVYMLVPMLIEMDKDPQRNGRDSV